VILESFETINEAFQAVSRSSLNLFTDPDSAPFTLLYMIILLKLLLFTGTIMQSELRDV